MIFMLYKDRLIELREEKNLKIHDISKLLNFEKDTYGKYEREYVIIPIKHLCSISDYYDVSLDYLFNFSDKKNYSNNSHNINLKLSSERLKNFRKENKLTQLKLATLLNTDNSTISKYEQQRNPIATPYLYTICKKYNISADYLLGRIDSPKYLK